MRLWWVDRQHPAREVAEMFGDIDRVFSLDGEVITNDSLSRVLRVTAGGKR